MSTTERLESKRRRDREYRQRKRLLKSKPGRPSVATKKMGRKSKFTTDEERQESKRKRDALYRERQKARQLVEGDLHGDVDSWQDAQHLGANNGWAEMNYSADLVTLQPLPCLNPQAVQKPQVAPRLSTSVSERSSNSRTVSPVDSEAKSAHGRKYFSKEEQVLAKRRRDAQYRERKKLKKLIAEESGGDHHVQLQAQPVAGTQVRVGVNFGGQVSFDVSHFDNNAMDGGDPRNRKLYSAEERAKGKLQRNAEYRERLRIKRLIDDQGLDLLNTTTVAGKNGYPELMVQAFDPSNNELLSLTVPELEARFPQRRRRYSNDEERAAAKRKRDAAYRQRRKERKQLGQSGDEAPQQLDFLAHAHPTIIPVVSFNGVYQDFNYPAFPEMAANSQHFVPQTVTFTVPQAALPEARQFEAQLNSVNSDNLDLRVGKSRRPYQSEAERAAARRLRDAEYRKRKKLKKMAAESLGVQLDFGSQSSTRPGGGSNQDLSRSFVQNFHESDHDWSSSSQFQTPNQASSSKPRRYNTEEERIAAKRRRDAKYREKKKLKRLTGDNSDAGSEKQQPQPQPQNSLGDAISGFGSWPGFVNTVSGQAWNNRPQAAVFQNTQLQYRPEDERLSGKKRRDAEYRERKKLEQILDDTKRRVQNIGHVGHVGNAAAAAAAKKGQKYFTEEERLEAKRQRDAEYRERRRLRKLEQQTGNGNQPNRGLDSTGNGGQAGPSNANLSDDDDDDDDDSSSSSSSR